MAAAKGNKYSKGRPKGKQNVVTQEIKERFKAFVDGNFHQVQGWLDRVATKDPAEAARLYLQFSERVIGKMSNSTIDITTQGEKLSLPTIHVYGSASEAD